MQQHVALLRGINVGGHRVKMDRLRGLFEGMRLQDVATVIASGNVVFSSDAKNLKTLRKKIERVLEADLGFEVPTFLRTPAELAALKPFVGAHDRASSEPWDSHYVMFLQASVPDELQLALSDLSSTSDAFLFADREIHWRVRGRLRDSPLFGRVMDKAMQGTVTTMRNMQTIRRILRATTAGN